MSQSSSQRPRPGGATYKQDYVVRIRYNNTLPPPLAPPKLLDIPNTAFAQYTDPSFASRLARAGPLNIETDSELGMPLDLIHVPRVFEGDNTAIRALDPVPAVHPADAALLRPAASLGKPISHNAGGGSNVSFLRRTEYISAEQSKSTFRSNSERALHAARQQKTKSTRPEDADPVRILAAVMKGFDTANPHSIDPANTLASLPDKAAANAERNWKELKHPNKPGVKAVATYPLLPHPEGTSDSRGYMVFKFSSAPTEAEPGHRDTRLDTALLQAFDTTPGSDDEDAAADPEAHQLFDLYVPSSTDVAAGVKRKFASPAEEAQEEFNYQYVRRYEVKNHVTYTGADTAHPEEIALVLHEGKAYYYPILTRLTIRPKRKSRFTPGMGMAGSQRVVEEEHEDMPCEALRLRVRDMDEAEKRRRVEYRARLEGTEVPGAGGAAATTGGDEDEDAPGEEE